MSPESGVTTLVASATIARTGQTNARGHHKGSAFEELTIGQHLRMQVLRQLEQQRYEVTFGGRRHVVESRVKLEPGTQIDAQVEAKGDQLELRYLNSGPKFELPEASAADSPLLQQADTGAAAVPLPPGLESLVQQFRVPLDARAREAIARAAAKVGDPELMTRGALFLQKLAHSVDPQDLEALYRTLSPAERGPAAALARAPIQLDDLSSQDDVSGTLADALDAQTSEYSNAQVKDLAADSDAGDGAQQDAQRALRLLNLQDEGSVAWRFGTLPLLVGGQLIELDLVMFRERESQGKRGSLRRLVMTLDTTHFGRVHVEARAVDSRLMVTLSAASNDALEVMSAYGQDVRGAIERLGWAVDDVRYELSAPNAGAAQSVVQHVLSTGTVDQEL